MTEEGKARFDASSIIREHLENVKAFMIFNMDAYNRNASGRHVNGLSVEATMGHGVLWSKEQWFYMETGRGAGKVPRGFKSILFQWVKDKGIQLSPKPYKRQSPNNRFSNATERAQWYFAGYVAYKIMTSGTALHRSGIREDIYSSAVERECQSIMQESRLKLGEIISNINKSAL